MEKPRAKELTQKGNDDLIQSTLDKCLFMLHHVLRSEIENTENLRRNMQFNDCFQKFTIREKKRQKRRRQEYDPFKLLLNFCQMAKCID